MKRMFYVSRFARPLSRRDLKNIHDTAVKNNRRTGLTGILVCLGDTFFQVLEGPGEAVDRLYHDRIVPDRRHKDVFCLKSENGVRKRLFPGWSMEVFNLNEQSEALPFAFRQMLTALLESSHTIAQYTQPSLFRLLERGVNPTTIRPRRRRVTVLFSDIIGFSQFAEHLQPGTLIELVNSHIDVCSRCVATGGGEVNKLTGDGVMAYFSDRTSDGAIEAAIAILREMKRRRRRAASGSPHRLLHGGVGLSNGLVLEGNVGLALKRDFTILGNTVNQASRLEGLTRELDVQLILSREVARRSTQQWSFVSLGARELKGQSRRLEVFGVGTLPRLNMRRLHDRMEAFVRQGGR